MPGPSYLFGTMHVRDERVFSLTGQVLPLIDSCDAFAAEFHLEELNTPEQGESMILPQGKSLEDYLSPRKFAKVRRMLLKTTGMDLVMFKNVLPFVVVNVAGEKLLQSDRPVSLDGYLWNYALEAGKEMHGIETIEEQLQTLRSISVEKQVKMLLDAVRNVSNYRRQIYHYADLYHRGELARLHKLMRKNAGGLRKQLLNERNLVMAQRIEDLARKKSLFAAVGAGHLLGGKGLIRLLKKRGLKLHEE